ncbi:MAG: hypothetical protein AABX48_01670 [Nanoarchaeota archaeon]
MNEVIDSFKNGKLDFPVKVYSCRNCGFDFSSYYKLNFDRIVKIDGFARIEDEEFRGEQIRFGLYEQGKGRFSPIELIVSPEVIKGIGYNVWDQVMNITIFLDAVNIDPFLKFYIAYGRHRQVSKKITREMVIDFKKKFGVGEGWIFGGRSKFWRDEYFDKMNKRGQI